MQRNTFILGVVLLHTLDQNKDAILSETEIAGAQQALLSLDENKDGEISGEEFSKAMPKTMQGMRGWRSDRGGAPHPFHDRGRHQDRRGRTERPEQDEASAE